MNFMLPLYTTTQALQAQIHNGKQDKETIIVLGLCLYTLPIKLLNFLHPIK